MSLRLECHIDYTLHHLIYISIYLFYTYTKYHYIEFLL